MRRPGYLGDLNDTWFGDGDAPRRPLVSMLLSAVARAAPKIAAKARPKLPPRPKSKPKAKAKPLPLPLPESKPKAKPRPLPMPDAKPLPLPLPDAKPLPLPMPEGPPPPRYDGDLPVVSPTRYDEDLPTISPTGPTEQTPITPVATQGLPTPQQQMQMAYPMMPGYMGPAPVAGRPMMQQRMQGPRIIRPSAAKPVSKPFITPQMERLGKIAAAIGAGLFFL